jgi:hypothetical protein
MTPGSSLYCIKAPGHQFLKKMGLYLFKNSDSTTERSLCDKIVLPPVTHCRPVRWGAGSQNASRPEARGPRSAASASHSGSPFSISTSGGYRPRFNVLLTHLQGLMALSARGSMLRFGEERRLTLNCSGRHARHDLPRIDPARVTDQILVQQREALACLGRRGRTHRELRIHNDRL